MDKKYIRNTSSSELQAKSKTAAKWSIATEVIVKVISPISQMVLARLLAPEAFGMVATVTMVVNFADMFSDAGFQKYLVQHSFKDRESLYNNANVAFWTNFGVSIALWGLVAVFNEPLAAFVGNPSLGIPLVIACLSLPLTAFSSIQMALFHRELDFKSLMPVRLLSSALNFALTLVLAFLGFSFWALIAGTLIANIVNAVYLTIKSKWKPRLFYSLNLLRKMFSFSCWTLLESLSIWLTTWSGTFIVGNILGSAALGLYKTPITFVSGCYNIITNATTPILFSALSRLQTDEKSYKEYFLRFQFVVSIVLLPLSVAIFIYREPLVLLLLGSQWAEATLMFGLYALVQGPLILFSYYCSEAYRSLGKPRVSTFVQIIYMAAMIPIMTLASLQGFDAVVFADAACRLLMILINQIVMYFVVGISFLSIIRSLGIPIFLSFALGLFSYVTYGAVSSNIILVILNVIASIGVYFAMCMAFSKTRKTLLSIFRDGIKDSVAGLR